MDNFNTYVNGIDFNAFLDFCREHGKIERLHKGELFVRRGTLASGFYIVVSENSKEQIRIE